MCFAPQRRALFPHRNFQKWHEHLVLCIFSLRNVLRATTACTFSTSELPKVVRTWCVLYILTWKCARRERLEERRVRRKKMQMREKAGKSPNTVFFQWFGAPEGRKVGSLKRRVQSQLARSEMKNCTPLWREAHLQVKMYKTPGARSTSGSWDVEKVHAVVARSTFPSQKCKNLRGTEHFWTFRCGFAWGPAGPWLD